MAQTMAPQAQDDKLAKFQDFASSLRNFKEVAELLRKKYGTGQIKEIDRICEWLLSNPKLAKKLAKDISEGNVDIDWTRPSYLAKDYLEISGGSYQNGNLFALGVWLAQRYLCDYFGIKDPKYPKIRQPDKNTKVFLSYNQDEHRIMMIPYVIEGSPAEAFIKGFTVGLHELGHGLKQTRDKEVCVLTEFSVALIMRDLSPPIEQKTGSRVNDSFGKMAVDPMNVKALEKQGFYQDDSDGSRLKNRYVAQYIMPWIDGWQGRTGKKLDIFDFKNTPAERGEAGVRIKKINEKIGPYLDDKSVSMSLMEAFYIYRELRWKHLNDDGFVADHFCKTEGITNSDLIGKMQEVFSELAKDDKQIDFQEFVERFNAALTKVFGEPKTHEYPPGYGHAPANESGFFRA